MKERLAYIDFAKGIGIYLMVLCHAGLHNMFTAWIYAFHMPLFWVISGYCYKNCPPHHLLVALFQKRLSRY